MAIAQRSDQRPRRLWVGEQVPVAQRDPGEQVQRVPEQRGLPRRPDEQLSIDPRTVLNGALVEPLRVALRGTAEPAAHGEAGRSSRAAMARNPDPAALAASACPITSVASARLGLSAPGRRIWVAPHSAQRARRGVTVRVAVPRPRTVRVRACPWGRRVPAHRGQRIAASHKLSSARCGQDTTITDQDSVHGERVSYHAPRREGASSCGAAPIVAPAVSVLPTTIAACGPPINLDPTMPSGLGPSRCSPW